MTDEAVPQRGSSLVGNNTEEETAIADKLDSMKAEENDEEADEQD